MAMTLVLSEVIETILLRYSDRLGESNIDFFMKHLSKFLSTYDALFVFVGLYVAKPQNINPILELVYFN